MSIVRIAWIDAHDFRAAEWVAVEDIEVGVTVDTVGHLVHETDEYYVISHSEAEDEVRGAFCIPKVNVRSFQRLSQREEDHAPEEQQQIRLVPPPETLEGRTLAAHTSAG